MKILASLLCTGTFLGAALTVCNSAPADLKTPVTNVAPLPVKASPVDASLVNNTAKLIYDVLVLKTEKTSEKDTEYYENGVWHFTNYEKQPLSQAGPATAAAALWNFQRRQLKAGTLAPELKEQATPEKQEWLHKIAVETLDRALQDHFDAAGFYGDKEKPDSYFFGVDLASATLDLGDSLDKETRARWTDSLVKIVDFLTKSGNIPDPSKTGLKATDGWYTNGNIELGEAELLYQVWKITGEQKYKDLFEVQWKHTLAPDPTRWAGFGLKFSKEPTKEDGSDGAGFLAENGGNGPGFDGSYTQVSLDVASRLYAQSRDPRVLRVINLLLNQLMPYITNENDWSIDMTGGSRKNYKGRMLSAGLPIAAWFTPRPDLAAKVPSQLAATSREYRGEATQNWNHPNFYRGLSASVAVLLEAANPAP